MGGVIAGAVSGGNMAAISVGSAISSTVSVGTDIAQIGQVSSLGGLAAVFGATASDLNDAQTGLAPVLPVYGTPTSITVNDVTPQIELAPSQINIPDTLTYSGGASGGGGSVGFCGDDFVCAGAYVGNKDN
jgi:hypothetical protein